jgi:hypothetical protein
VNPNFFDIAKMRTDTLLGKFLPSFLKFYGYRPKLGKFYVYATGKIPILLIAHVDTVFIKPPQKIFLDRKHQVYFSPDGLGADDRSGVFGILKLVSLGYRPSLLFTDLEESGGLGAQFFADHEEPEWNVIFAIDRHGENEAAIYDCDSEPLRKILDEYDFKIVHGSFSDISIICPRFGVAGANVSAGFYENHTRHEYFCEKSLWNTIEKLSRIMENPPSDVIKYVPKPVFDYRALSYDDLDFCPICGEEAELFELNGEKICALCYHELIGKWPTNGEKIDRERKTRDFWDWGF